MVQFETYRTAFALKLLCCVLDSLFNGVYTINNASTRLLSHSKQLSDLSFCYDNGKKYKQREMGELIYPNRLYISDPFIFCILRQLQDGSLVEMESQLQACSYSCINIFNAFPHNILIQLWLFF